MKPQTGGEVIDLSGGELSVWLEDSGAVMLKFTGEYPDPVELGENELEELIEVLTRLRDQLKV